MAALIGLVILPPASGAVCDDRPDAACLREWMQAAGSILALVGAVFGAYYLNKQIRQSEEQHRYDRKRRHTAIRAAMPLALSKISVYAEDTFKYLRDIRSRIEPDQRLGELDIPDPPPLPDEVVVIFKEFIETDDNDNSILAQRLLSKIQVQNSRMQSLDRDKDSYVTYTLESFLEESAVIVVMNASLYKYARFESEVAPRNIEWVDVQKAIRFRLHDAIFDQFIERINAKAGEP